MQTQKNAIGMSGKKWKVKIKIKNCNKNKLKEMRI